MALIKCPECGKEVSSSASSCPNCGHPISPKETVVEKTVIKEKKKGSCLSKILMVIGFFVIIGVLYAALSDDSSNKPKKVSATSSNGSVAEPETSETKDIFEIGEIAEYNDIQVFVTGFDKTNGNDFSKPDAGKEFVYINVDIANNSNDDLAISSMLSFTAYCDDYKLDYSSGALMAMDGKNQLDGTISPGKKMNGYLGLEVPTNWKSIELQFTDNVWSSNKFKFEIKNK